jgi:hypothetical protein
MPIVNNAVLNSVACASSSECWAVGYYNNGSLYQTLIERWDGNSWTVVASPNGNGVRGSQLYGVACTSTADCWTVGYDIGNAPTTLNQTLIERWNGTSWNIVTSPNHGNAHNELFGLACSSASDCWAVGAWDDGESGDSLFEHWNGATWSIFASSPTGIGFTSVACASASDCWAVTPSGDPQFGQPVSAHWNGATWAIVPLPLPPSNPPGQGYVTYSVTCAAASECWAVGYYDNGVAARTLIERWDGTSWSVVTSPNNGNSTQANYLYGVACASASQCWAVGYYVSDNGIRSLIEEFAPTIPPLTGIGSRKVHGSTPFDIDLLNASPGIECRNPGSTGTPGADYKVVFSFVNNVTNCGTASTGSLSSGPNLNQCTVDLTGVANQQYLTVTLSNVLDAQANTGDVSATMGVLLGDVNGNRNVSNTDVAAVKAQVAAPVTASNFRNDMNANGIISNTDVSTAKAQVGTTLP